MAMKSALMRSGKAYSRWSYARRIHNISSRHFGRNSIRHLRICAEKEGIVMRAILLDFDDTLCDYEGSFDA